MSDFKNFRKKINQLLKEVYAQQEPSSEIGTATDARNGSRWSTTPYHQLVIQVRKDMGENSPFYKELTRVMSQDKLDFTALEKVVNKYDIGGLYSHYLNMNEISSGLFRRATDITKSREQNRRTMNMGSTFFREFVGKPLMGGQIIEVNYLKPSHGHYEQVQIMVKKPSVTNPEEPKIFEIYYDILNDTWEVPEVDRADARILGMIAMKINPNSKYKNPAQHITIKGYMEENDDFEDEGPQPGDAEYHNQGMGKIQFNPADNNQIKELFIILKEEGIPDIRDYYPRWVVNSLIDNGYIEESQESYHWFFTQEGLNYFTTPEILKSFLLEEGSFN